MINVDDEEKVINAVYLMTFDPAAPEYAVGNRFARLADYHDWPRNNETIGLMIFLIRLEKVQWVWRLGALRVGMKLHLS